MALTSVTITPNNPSLALNETVKFTATADDTPDSYQWNVDGSNVSGADQSTHNYSSLVLGTHTVKCYAIKGETTVVSETETVKVWSLGDMIRAVLEAMD